jgi:hypothetical protein
MSDRRVGEADLAGGDDDFLDGLCDLDFIKGPDTTEDLLPWVVLFADLLTPAQLPESLAAVEARADEWRALFGGAP